MAHVQAEQPRETSGLTVRLVLSYVRKVAGPEGVQELLRRAGETRPLEVLENEREWCSYDAKIALFRAASEVTGQPDVGLRVGSHVFDSAVGPSVRLMLSMFGSPAQLLRHVAHTNAKFTSCGDLSAEMLSSTSAVVTYRLHEGYTPSRFDCDYVQGMLAQAPPLFGLPPAQIEHEQCQVDGASACVYVVSWQRRPRIALLRRARAVAVDATVVHQRLQELQHAVTDLVGRGDLDLDSVLVQVVERAGYAVSARAFVLAAQLEPGEAPAVHAQGLPMARAREVAARLLRGLPPRSGEHVISAPVRSAGRDFGTLAALADAPFLPGEEDLLQAYAALAAAALDGLVARHETEYRRRTAEILLALASEVGTARHGSEVVRAATAALRALPPADVACVLLADPDGTLRLAGHAGFADQEVDRLAAARLEPSALPELARLLSAPHQAELVDAAADGPWLAGLLTAVGVGQAAVLGLRCAEHVHGLGLAGWRERPLSGRPATSSRVLERLVPAAVQATTGLDKTELLHQVQLQARTDSLTGLVNRRHFLEVLEAEQARVTRQDTTAGLLFLDLDGFKDVNDTLGHAAGDALLVELSRRVAACLGPGDLLARLGGDEFTVLSPAVFTEGDLVGLAERVLVASDAPVDVEGRSVVVRPSIGAALVQPGNSASSALRAADEAMYAAKASGGGRVVLADQGVALGGGTTS